MILQLTSLMFAGIIICLTIFDQRRLRTILTPFTVTAWPFVIISILVNFVLVDMQFQPITLRVHFFILVNLFILYLCGFILSFFVNKGDLTRNATPFSAIFKPFAVYDLFIVMVSWLVIIATLYQAYSLLRHYGGFAFLGDPRFEEMMIVGIVAHLVQLGKVCFILLCFLYKNSRYKIIIWPTLIGLFIAIAAIQVKYHLLWLLIMVYFFNFLEKPVKQQLKNLLLVALSVIVIMNLFWILLTLAWGTFSVSSRGIHEFLFKLTMNYITTGPVALNQWLNHADCKPEWTMLTVFLNLKNVITGNPLRLNNLQYVNLGFLETGPGLSSNVGTAYGVYYIVGGWVFTLFMTTVVSLLSYWIFYKTRQIKNPYIIFFNLLALTLGLLTFFVQYFTLLSLYEMTAIYVLFIAVFQLLNFMKSTSLTPELIK